MVDQIPHDEGIKLGNEGDCLGGADARFAQLAQLNCLASTELQRLRTREGFIDRGLWGIGLLGEHAHAADDVMDRWARGRQYSSGSRRSWQTQGEP